MGLSRVTEVLRRSRMQRPWLIIVTRLNVGCATILSSFRPFETRDMLHRFRTFSKDLPVNSITQFI